MTLESIKIRISGMFLSNSRFSSSFLLWDIGISEQFCIENALFWGDDTNPSIFLVLPHRLSVFSSFFGSGLGSSVFFFASFLVSTTCQVGHFDSHTFWFLIEFFIENLVLTGGRYILPGPLFVVLGKRRRMHHYLQMVLATWFSVFLLDLTASKFRFSTF